MVGVNMISKWLIAITKYVLSVPKLEFTLTQEALMYFADYTHEEVDLLVNDSGNNPIVTGNSIIPKGISNKDIGLKLK